MPIYDQIFGSFSKNSNDPLSRISQANSCISLDPFGGCSLGCVYCYRHNSKRDTNLDTPTRFFEDEEIVDALLEHPYFIPDKTIIGINTASTDLFPKVVDSLFNIVRLVAEKGYKNPFWIVTKKGVPPNTYSKFKEVLDGDSKGIVLSVTYSDMPSKIEPYQKDRFKHLGEAIRAGVHVSLHLRPIVKGWNDDYNHIKKAVKRGVEAGCESICIGGLRFLEGIKKSITEIHGMGLPKGATGDELNKTLPPNALKFVQKSLTEIGTKLPLFLHSSQVISYALGIPDYNLYRFRNENKENLFLNIPISKQKEIARRKGREVNLLIEHALEELKIENVKVKIEGRKIYLSRDLKYKEEKALIHRLGLQKFY